MQLVSLKIGTSNLLSNPAAPQPTNKNILAGFSHILNHSSVESEVTLADENGTSVDFTIDYLDNDKTIVMIPDEDLSIKTNYTLTISDQLLGANGETFVGYSITFLTENPPLEILALKIDDRLVENANRVIDVNRNPSFEMAFSHQVNRDQLKDNLGINGVIGTVDFTVNNILNDSVFNIAVNTTLDGYEKYVLTVSDELTSVGGNSLEAFYQPFYTKVDSTLKFPEISDDALLTKVQEQTFKYFWDFAHPVSGLARERNTSGETVTSGGSGFGLMAILVGIERGFITKEAGIDRLEKIVSFLLDDADKFHGAWSHWLNGTSGTVIPFSANDDGGDLVETAFMVQGLLTVRQYLDATDPQQSAIIDNINTLWEGVEWDWYTQDGQDVLYWHWSPNFGWEKNHQITGWNESLIVYVLAASSPTHAIESEVYTEGWSRNGNMVNGNNSSYYGYQLDLRTDRGGPLFFAHYSFLGLDPRNLSDQFADYWDQNVNHSLINRGYCTANPRGFVGYSSYSWGLTASDNHQGYSAHSPDNDLGVITPTAALSSMPYTPEESLAALHHFYYILGDRLWGEYGFYDAFNITEGWTASSYLAIDQGPIVVMIENYRTGLLWDLFMSAPEVQQGLEKLGFTYE